MIDQELTTKIVYGTDVKRKIWQIGIGSACFFLILSIYLPLAINASYDNRLQKDANRTFSFVMQPDGTQTGYVRKVSQSINYKPVSGAVIKILNDAPAPPGLKTWPGPGEVYASQALLNEPGSSELLAVYGEVKGTIQHNGLTDPGERLFYAGALQGTDLKTKFIAFNFPGEYTGVVTGDVGGAGAAEYYQNRSAFFKGIIGFCLFPALVLTLIAVQIGREERRSNIARLRSLGATPKQIRKALWETYSKLTKWWLSAGALVIFSASSLDWKVPILNQYVVAKDLQNVRWTLIPIGLGVAILVYLLMLWVGRESATKPQGTKGQAASQNPKPIALVTILVLAFVAYMVYSNTKATDPGLANSVVFLTACGAVLFFTKALEYLLFSVGRFLRKTWKRPTGVLVVSELLAEPRRIARATVFIAVVAVLGFQIEFLTTQQNQEVEAAKQMLQQRTEGTRGSSYALLGLEQVPATQLREALPPEVVLVKLGVSAAGTVVIAGECGDLNEIFDADCGAELSLNQVVAKLGGVMVAPGYTLVDDEQATADYFGSWVVSASGEPLIKTEIERSLYQKLGQLVVLSEDGSEWLGDHEVTMAQSKWYVAGVVFGCSALLMAAALALFNYSISVLRQIRDLRFFISQRGFSFGYTCASLLIPIGVAWLFGNLVALAGVAAPALVAKTSSASLNTPIYTGVAAVGLTLVLCAYLTRVAEKGN